jgi:hypothetical protein
MSKRRHNCKAESTEREVFSPREYANPRGAADWFVAHQMPAGAELVGNLPSHEAGGFVVEYRMPVAPMTGLNLNLTFERIAEPELHTAPGIWMIHYAGQAGEKPAQQTIGERRLEDGGTAWSVRDMADGYWWAIHRSAGQRPGLGRKVWFEVRSGAVVKAWTSMPSAVKRVYDAQNERIQRELRGGGR